MEADLAYYRRRSAEERIAAEAAPNGAAREAHTELARLYGDRVASLEARIDAAPLHLVSAA
jgi:hypothetical protein